MSIVVREAERRDLPRIKSLVDDYIALDFYPIAALEEILRGEDDLLYVAVDTERGDLVVSYFYAFLSTLDDALRILLVPDKPPELQKYRGDERVGVFKITSTDPAYRNRGIFSSFMTDLQPVLRDRGARLIMNTALRPVGRDVPIRNVLAKTGFVPVEEILRPWTTSGYCPYCKQAPCICDAVLYIREFDEEKEEENDG